MAAPAPVTPDTPIVIKITVNNTAKKLKLPLRDLGVSVLPGKVSDKPQHAVQHLTMHRHCSRLAPHSHLIIC